ncbi:EAL domain-containing protein [Tianweitania sp. BSSL-BM11]|uniref:EAL domain-containing protein n=1 Tax=Tianweitania aestuarii TaxID=2814886 RepID=A0ABS5RXP7_9HYPH|nr:EAL domain-containing protein [Tianweitania aestuarii]MBS9721004.1 EAL domain-containing protein [Tianweitania aestuarii]
MTRNFSRAEIAQGEDGIHTAVWGSYVLQSAFQPIFSLEEGRLSLVAFEALLRPVHGTTAVSPSQFFRQVPAADRFAVETLTRTLHLLNAGKCLDKSATLFVNFDPSQFQDRELADGALRDMLAVLKVADLEPSRIVCEMTEQVSTCEPVLFGFVEALRAEGFRIAVDDYGSGDSDLRRVEQLKPDIVKFDAAWINQMMASGAGMALLKMVVASFSQNGIETVIEGVEEGWQMELAQHAGAPMVQGYLLARPQLALMNFTSFTLSGQGTPRGFDPAIPLSLAQMLPSEWTAARALPGAQRSEGVQLKRSRTFGRRQVMR